MTHGFKPNPQYKKRKLGEDKQRFGVVSQIERAAFDLQCKKASYHFIDTTFWSVLFRGVPKGMVKSFIVVLDEPMKRKDVEKLLTVFGEVQ